MKQNAKDRQQSCADSRAKIEKYAGAERQPSRIRDLTPSRMTGCQLSNVAKDEMSAA